MGDKIFLIIGNGINIDLCKFLKITDMDPQSPFQIKVPWPLDKRKSLLKNLHTLNKSYNKHPKPEKYKFIYDFLANPHSSEYKHIRYQLRLYLSLAFSYVTQEIRKKWKKGWFWEKWFQKNSNNIIGIVTFNYDLILETTLNKISVEYYRIGSDEVDESQGIPIFKPHGSCDFGIKGMTFSDETILKAGNIEEVQYITKGKGRVKIVSDSELLSPKNVFDLVLPGEFSQQIKKLAWVWQGYDTIKEIMHKANYLIIIGSSYAECDRPEIDLLIKEFPTNRKISYINRRKNIILRTTLEKRSENIKFINADNLNDFSDIDCNHDYKKSIDTKHYYILKCKKCDAVDRVNK